MSKMIQIFSHNDAVALAENTTKNVVQIRIEESLKLSKILPDRFLQPVRLGSSVEGFLEFTVFGTLIGRKEEQVSFFVEVKKDKFTINCKDSEIRKVLEEIVSSCMDKNKFDKLDNVIEGKIYQHYKGGLYKVLFISTQTETGEELVNYYNIHKPNVKWSRPKEMFMDGRFQPID